MGLFKNGACRKASKMEWDGEKQSRLDTLRAAELSGTLDEAGEAEMKALLELVETEERERLAPTFARIREEQAALRLKVQESEAANEQLVALIAQQERWLADARHSLQDLQHRHRAMQKTYQLITGEPLTVS
jgi:hypothetical protein